MTRNLRFVIVCTACVLTTAIAACTTTSGRKVEIDGVRQIKEGVTNKADVERLIGPPEGTHKSLDGTENSNWRYVEMTSAGLYSAVGWIDSKGSSISVAITFQNDIVTRESLIKSRSFSLLHCHSISETERG